MASYVIKYCNATDCKTIQYWNDCNLPHFVAAVISIHPRTCAKTYFESTFGINKSFVPLLWFSLWGKHGSLSSGFSRGVLIVTFWLAEELEWLAAPKSLSVQKNYNACRNSNIGTIWFCCSASLPEMNHRQKLLGFIAWIKIMHYPYKLSV